MNDFQPKAVTEGGFFIPLPFFFPKSVKGLCHLVYLYLETENNALGIRLP